MAENPGAHRAGQRLGRTYLDVPYAETGEAKALGARWDPQAKRWYDPRPTTPGLDRWAARPDVPDLLPGDDREFGGTGLFVDLVPSSCWFTNVRTCVSPQDWERLRRTITRRAGHRCEVCGAGEDRGVSQWLEAHERWSYDAHNGVQSLRRLICLCTDCHRSTHFGRANLTGRADQAFTHLCAVTGMTAIEARRHIDTAGELWTHRSRRIWSLDLSILTDAGITLAQPEQPAERAAAAQRELLDARQLRDTSQPTPFEPTQVAEVPASPEPSCSWFRRIFGG